MLRAWNSFPTPFQTLQDLVARDAAQVQAASATDQFGAKVVAVAELPTIFGHFKVVAFENDRDRREHIAVVHGNVLGQADVMTRIHSECLTGDALGSLRCDCREQLGMALTRIAREPCGLLLYTRQEGRGIGLTNKIRAYELQDRGLDTVDANLALGFRDDERDYVIAAQMIASLTISSVRLLTNNLKKVDGLQREGIRVSARVPHIIAANEYNQFYLRTKANRSGHLIKLNRVRACEQSDPAVVVQNEE